MNRWSKPQRTAADRERDCVTFCATAPIERVEAASAEVLAARYGCSLAVARYRRALRLGDWG